MDFEGIYCFDTASVRFAFYPDGDDGARILGLVSEQTLRDVCGARDGSSESLLATCRSHFSLIRDKAIELYFADPSRAVVLTTGDFARPAIPEMQASMVSSQAAGAAARA
jgi:hypothetical protein